MLVGGAQGMCILYIASGALFERRTTKSHLEAETC